LQMRSPGDCKAFFIVAALRRRGVADVIQRDALPRFEEFSVLTGRIGQSGRRARRNQQNSVAPRRRAGPRREPRSFLQHDVGIRSTEPEGADTGETRHLRARPGSRLRGYTEPGPFERDVWIQILEVEVGGNLLVVKREHRLNEAGDACRCFQVAEVRLGRTQYAWWRSL